jgi:hypothetical protein
VAVGGPAAGGRATAVPQGKGRWGGQQGRVQGGA